MEKSILLQKLQKLEPAWMAIKQPPLQAHTNVQQHDTAL